MEKNGQLSMKVQLKSKTIARQTSTETARKTEKKVVGKARHIPRIRT